MGDPLDRRLPGRSPTAHRAGDRRPKRPHYKFLATDRHQPFLLPPDLRDWRPADHLARFILDVVDQLDLEPLLRCYRADGHGHPAYHPKTLLAVLLYAYAVGVRSSRQIQRRCTEEFAFRCWPATARLTR